MDGKRLRQAREEAGLTQADLAAAVGKNYDQTKLSKVENGHIEMRNDIMIAACRVLNVSADWLLGIAHDPEPESIRHKAEFPSLDFLPLQTQGVIAGISGGTVAIPHEETYAFRHSRLSRMDIEPGRAKIYRVSGDSMLPVLPNGTSILVDYARTDLVDSHLYVLRSNGSLLVKRAKRWLEQWWWISENPNWAAIRHDDSMQIYGRVRWYGRYIGSDGT